MDGVSLAFYKAFGNKNATIIDKIIALWTRGKYSHVEIVIDGYMYSSSPREGKVRKKKHIENNESWDYINVKVDNKQTILDFFSITEGNKYDWMGIVGFIIPFKDRTNEWFCSEWCSNALKISGVKYLWKKEPSKISPDSLWCLIMKNEGKQNGTN